MIEFAPTHFNGWVDSLGRRDGKLPPKNPLLEALKCFNSVLDDRNPFQNFESNDEARSQFRDGFSEIIDTFDTSGLDYRVVGSFAIAASVNGTGKSYDLTPYRRNKTRRDVDILVLDSDTGTARQLEIELNKGLSAHPNYPEVSLSIPSALGDMEDLRTASFLPIIVTRLAFDKARNLFAIYHEHRKQIPAQYLERQQQTYDSVSFPTADPGVLAGFALTRTGFLRSKDIQKVALLMESTGAQIPQEFLEFAGYLQTTYPDLYKNFMVRELLYHFSGGIIRSEVLASAKSLFRTEAH